MKKKVLNYVFAYLGYILAAISVCIVFFPHETDEQGLVTVFAFKITPINVIFRQVLPLLLALGGLFCYYFFYVYKEKRNKSKWFYIPEILFIVHNTFFSAIGCYMLVGYGFFYYYFISIATILYILMLAFSICDVILHHKANKKAKQELKE